MNTTDIEKSDKMQVKLKTTCVLSVPFQKYESNFTFVVNNELYPTSRITADLLSPKICKIHFNDPTFNEMTIKTHSQGNFQYFLDLINFSENNIPTNEIPFLTEVANILENKSLDFYNQKSSITPTLDNIFDLIKEHEKNQVLYSKSFKEEIDFVSLNFYKFNEKQIQKLASLQIKTIESILSNTKLQLSIEDQLLKFINQIYLNDSKNSYLYEYVEFANVTGTTITEFLDIFDLNDLTNELWKLLSVRLEQEIININPSEIRHYTNNNIRYEGIDIPFNENQIFNGIINYIKNNSKINILDEINITASSSNNHKIDGPQNAILFDDQSKDFRAINSGDVWICFDFKYHTIIPSNYTIRSYGFGIDFPHPKSWVIEGSNDNNNWMVIDEQRNCPFLNGSNLIHTFTIQDQKQEKFQFIRLRLTGPNWNDSHQLSFDSIEFYGKLF